MRCIAPNAQLCGRYDDDNLYLNLLLKLVTNTYNYKIKYNVNVNS